VQEVDVRTGDEVCALAAEFDEDFGRYLNQVPDNRMLPDLLGIITAVSVVD
jgi:hypothetical protein